MIAIDRASPIPVHEQLVEQLRFQIASGQYKVDQSLPSTRALADQIGVSFHTVRKAYQHLEREGHLEARKGSGFRVRERIPLSKSVRIEQGASVVQDALQKLVGLGLQEAEMDYLFQEQLDRLSAAAPRLKIIFAAPYQEMAQLCATQLSSRIQQPVEPVTLDRLDRHRDADFAIARFPDLPRVMEAVPHADPLGVVTYLNPAALDPVVRLLSHETLGLITQHAGTIQPLLADLRIQTGFSGQVLATSIDVGSLPLKQFIEQTDLLIYTPPCRRRLRPLLDKGPKHVRIEPLINHDSMTLLQKAIPG